MISLQRSVLASMALRSLTASRASSCELLEAGGQRLANSQVGPGQLRGRLRSATATATATLAICCELLEIFQAFVVRPENKYLRGA